NAWPRLRERGLSATCYLATSVIGNDALIWLNEFNWFLRTHAQVARPVITRRLGMGSASPVKAVLRNLVNSFSPMKVETLLPELRAQTHVDHRALARKHQLHLEWSQIAEMSAGGMAFGNHTLSHTPLGQLDPDACRAEIRGALPALEHLPGAVRTLAYPFGSRREETRQVALALGIHSLLEVEGVNQPLDPTRIGRSKVGCHSVAALFARMEIVEPVKWRLKRWMRRFGLGPALEQRPVHT